MGCAEKVAKIRYFNKDLLMGILFLVRIFCYV